jgi:hypothetical protein
MLEDVMQNAWYMENSKVESKKRTMPWNSITDKRDS